MVDTRTSTTTAADQVYSAQRRASLDAARRQNAFVAGAQNVTLELKLSATVHGHAHVGEFRISTSSAAVRSAYLALLRAIERENVGELRAILNGRDRAQQSGRRTAIAA